MSGMHAHTFVWNGDDENVLVTGSFDDWKSTLPLTKGVDGRLSAILPVAFGDKITYKYVVNGNWQHNPNEPYETDASGNINNVFTAPPAPAVAPSAESEPVLPVPSSVGTTDATVPPAEEIQAAVAKETGADSTTPAVEEKKDEPIDFVGMATAGVAAAVAGAGALAGAAFTAVSGAQSPLTLVSSQDEEKTTVAAPAAPAPTPAPPATVADSTPPAVAEVDKAIEEEKQNREQNSQGSVAAPVAAGLASGVAAVGAGATYLSQKTGEAASAAQQSNAGQYTQQYAGDAANKAVELKDTAVAQGNKAAQVASDKVGGSEFGASTMKALGLDGKTAGAGAGANEPTPVTATQPTIPAAAVAPVQPIDGGKSTSTATSSAPALPQLSTASAPVPVAVSQPTVPAAATAPTIPLNEASSNKTTAAPTPLPIPAATSDSAPAAGSAPPATPAKDPQDSSPKLPPPVAAVSSTLKKKAEGLGVGNAGKEGEKAAHPSSSTTGSTQPPPKKDRKPSIFQRIFKSSPKK